MCFGIMSIYRQGETGLCQNSFEERFTRKMKIRKGNRLLCSLLDPICMRMKRDIDHEE